MPKNYIDETKFFADAMLGRLSLWMRILGFDVSYESFIEDEVLVERANKEDRIILTRDTLLIKRKLARNRSFFIKSDDFKEQLAQVLKKYEIPEEITEDNFLTRCLKCNVALKPVEKGEVKDKVPVYVFETEESFSKCENCSRIFWQGTHTDEMKKVMTEIRELMDK